MRYWVLVLMLAAQTAWAGANYESEKEKADQALASLAVGKAQYLEAQNRKFLTLYTEASKPKAGLVIVHGSEANPDQGLIGVLRKRLVEHGYTTLSVQMPVLGFEGNGRAYAPLFPEAADRIGEAVKFLQDQGYKQIALVSHSIGSGMALGYLKGHAEAPIAAWVAVGMTSDSYDGTSVPIYDLYGENDIPPVLRNPGKRASSMSNSKSMQTVVPQTDHFFTGRDDDLVNYVRAYLDKSL